MTYNGYITQKGKVTAGYIEMYQSIDTLITGKKTFDYVIKHTETFPYPDKKRYVFTTFEKGSTNNWIL
jgi:dihydrofolate reductase